MADANVTEGAAGVRTRAFDPAQAGSYALTRRAPGWDQGPERRIDDGRSIARMLMIAGAGIVAVLLGAALLRRARRD